MIGYLLLSVAKIRLSGFKLEIKNKSNLIIYDQTPFFPTFTGKTALPSYLLLRDSFHVNLLESNIFSFLNAAVSIYLVPLRS